MLDDRPGNLVKTYSVRGGKPQLIASPELKIDSKGRRVHEDVAENDPTFWWRARFNGVNKSLLRVLLERLIQSGLAVRLLQPSEFVSPVIPRLEAAEAAKHRVATQTVIAIDLFSSRIPS